MIGVLHFCHIHSEHCVYTGRGATQSVDARNYVRTRDSIVSRQKRRLNVKTIRFEQNNAQKCPHGHDKTNHYKHTITNDGRSTITHLFAFVRACSTGCRWWRCTAQVNSARWRHDRAPWGRIASPARQPGKRRRDWRRKTPPPRAERILYKTPCYYVLVSALKSKCIKL